jgi:hypothetical protein
MDEDDAGSIGFVAFVPLEGISQPRAVTCGHHGGTILHSEPRRSRPGGEEALEMRGRREYLRIN